MSQIYYKLPRIRKKSYRSIEFCSSHGVALCQRVNIHHQNQTLFKIGAIKDKYANTNEIEDWG